MIFIEMMITILVISIVVTCKIFSDSKSLITYTSILNQGFIDAYNYASNVTGSKPFLQMKETDQDIFMEHVIGFLKLNYRSTLKQLNMFSDNDRICSMMISKISQQ